MNFIYFDSGICSGAVKIIMYNQPIVNAGIAINPGEMHGKMSLACSILKI